MLYRIFLTLIALFFAPTIFGASSPVAINSPRGGELYVIGQMQFVRLAETTKYKSVRIELSRDGGANYAVLGVIDNTVPKQFRNFLKFQVTGPVSSNCIIRATGISQIAEATDLTGAFVITDTTSIIPPIVAAGGDLTGNFPNPTIATNAVTSEKIADLAVTSAKVNSGTSSPNFVLAADGLNGANWVPLLNIFPFDIGSKSFQTSGTITASVFTGSGSGLTGISANALPITGAPYVLKAGDAMTGPLLLSGNPSMNQHAATKEYVDVESARAKSAETILTNNLTFETTRAQSAETILTNNLTSETTRATAAETAKVSKSGDTMSGQLVLSGDPLSNLHAATKQYVDMANATQDTNSVALFQKRVTGVAPANEFITGINADGTVSSGPAIPSGFSILTASATPPAAYTYSGVSLQSYNWATMASMLTARLRTAAASVGGKIYIFGGYLSSNSNSPLSITEEYNPATNSWQSRANMNQPTGVANAASFNGKIYVIGGFGGPGVVYSKNDQYDPISNSWLSKTSMPTARGAPSVSESNGLIYVMGGVPSGGGYLSVVEVYNPTNDSWATLQSMPTLRVGHGAAVLNGKVYVLGGENGSGLLNSVERYDIGNNSWSSVASLSVPRSNFAAYVVNGKIYAVGGNASNNSPIGSVEEYDPALDNWKVVSTMPTPRSDLSIVGLNNDIYAIGGTINRAGSVDSTANERFRSSILFIHTKN